MKIVVINDQKGCITKMREEMGQIYGYAEVEYQYANTVSDWETIYNIDNCDIFAVGENVPLNQLHILLTKKPVIMRTEKGWKQVIAVSIKTKPIS